MIILEGVDSSGKSTLARLLAQPFNLSVITSEGPARSKKEINERIQRYDTYSRHTIFDRHPIISEPIYASVWGRANEIDPAQYARFWSKDPLVIFCRPRQLHLTSQLNSHVDTPEYVGKLKTHYSTLIEAYDYFFSVYEPAVVYDWQNISDIKSYCRDYLCSSRYKLR